MAWTSSSGSCWSYFKRCKYTKKPFHLLNERRQYIENQCERLGGGIQRIAEASTTLDELNAVLAVQQVKVEEQSKNCESLLVHIEESTKIAINKKSVSEEKRQEIEERNILIKNESEEARVALQEAQPVLENARAALGNLDKSDITEIRSDLIFIYLIKIFL